MPAMKAANFCGSGTVLRHVAPMSAQGLAVLLAADRELTAVNCHCGAGHSRHAIRNPPENAMIQKQTKSKVDCDMSFSL